MRPINLIPQDERRADSANSRTGPIAYILVGALAVLLIGVTMLVTTSNQISERESEVESLEARKTAATARAERLAPYASFAQVSEQRVSTVASLADSRFDWERVIRQLSLILPPRVFFTSFSASAGGGSGEADSEVVGPSLTLVGCAPSQEAVAGFVASLKEIDGVTRVGLKNSTFSGGEGQTGSSFCSRGHNAQFEILVAFDGAPPSPDSTDAEAAETAEASESESSETEGSSESGSEETSGSGSSTEAEGTASSATTGSAG
jgi:Tfp pilus assembly protein PilN